MASGADGALAQQLARRVTLLRQAGGLTLMGLAQRSGLSAAFLSQIETGGANPTLRTLAQLAAGLGCEPAELFGATGAASAQFEPHLITAPPPAGFPAIWDASAAGARQLAVRLVRGPAGDHGRPVTHVGEEVLTVLAGQCTVHAGETTMAISAGQSCHLSGGMPHSYSADGELLALVVLSAVPS